MKVFVILFLLASTVGYAQNNKQIIYDEATNTWRFSQNTSVAANGLALYSVVRQTPSILSGIGSQTSSIQNLIEAMDQDSSIYRFASFRTSNQAVYVNKDEIGSFEFKDPVLISKDGGSWALNTTIFSNSITSSLSAAPGNGGSQVLRGIYQYDVKGSDDNSYLTLKAPSTNDAVSLTLIPSANVSGDNEKGFYSIKSVNGNNFSIGTLSASQGFIGFEHTDGTTIQLSAANLITSGNFSHNGLFNTNSLMVSNGSLDGVKIDNNVMAGFISYDPNGGVVEINNVSSSSNAFTALALSQGTINSRVVTYSINSKVYLPGSFSFETNSPNGMLFTIDNALNGSSAFHYSIASKELFTISAKWTSIANALHLEPISEDQMLQLDYPDATLVNNGSRKKIMFCDGTDWYEVEMKKVQLKPKAREL
jgi:hypothetical protein